MVQTFTTFHPLGVVLVTLLGVGVAEHTGYINGAPKSLLNAGAAIGSAGALHVSLKSSLIRL